jgi:hypothetical protein
MKQNIINKVKASKTKHNDDGIAMVTTFLIVLLFVAFLVFVANVANIALGLAVIGISFIIIAAGINAIRNSFSKKRQDYSEGGPSSSWRRY